MENHQAIKRTAAGLRDALFDEIDALRSGAGDHKKAMAVANLAKQIINMARAEIDMHNKLNKDERLCDDFMTGKLDLGSPKSIAK